MKIGLVQILLFNNSRKVGLGLWIFYPVLGLFIFAQVRAALHPAIAGEVLTGITFDQFMLAAGLVTSLVAGGTWMDKHYAVKGVPDANPQVPQK